jgi:hypothetical protein
MSYEIALNNLPLEFTIKTEDNVVFFNMQGFASSGNKEKFARIKHSFIDNILCQLPDQIQSINDFLAVIRRDGVTSIYVNELKEKVSILMQIKNKCDMEVGKIITTDEIADIQKVIIKEISIPNDAGFIFLFPLISEGHVVIYDFAPIHPEEVEIRTYDIENFLGNIYSYFEFQYLFKIGDNEWEQMFEQQWFPFISLGETIIKNMLDKIRDGSSIDVLTEEIDTKVRSNIENTKRIFQDNPAFNGHLSLINQGIKYFLEGDYIGSISTIYPQIEGIMRTNYIKINPSKASDRVYQNELVTSITKDSEDTNRNLLLPDRFNKYLKQQYFKDFTREDTNLVSFLSRNTVGHGVADPNLYDLKGSVIGILILEQLSFYI